MIDMVYTCPLILEKFILTSDNMSDDEIGELVDRLEAIAGEHNHQFFVDIRQLPKWKMAETVRGLCDSDFHRLLVPDIEYLQNALEFLRFHKSKKGNFPTEIYDEYLRCSKQICMLHHWIHYDFMDLFKSA